MNKGGLIYVEKTCKNFIYIFFLTSVNEIVISSMILY